MEIKDTLTRNEVDALVNGEIECTDLAINRGLAEFGHEDGAGRMLQNWVHMRNFNVSEKMHAKLEQILAVLKRIEKVQK